MPLHKDVSAKVPPESREKPLGSPPIPFTDFGGTGAPLHFLHANGYPPACYLPLLEHLQAHFRVFGMHLRPLWANSKPDELRDWHPLADDLLRFLSGREAGPVIGVGHSIGGIVTLRAALREPHRFRALVLIDPVLFPPYFILFWNLVRAAGLGYKFHPKVSGALTRRRHFDDLELVFRGYRRRDVFRNFSDESLRAYIAGITRPRAGGGREAFPKGGWELAFSPEWEAHIYHTGIWRDLDLWHGLKQLRAPTLFLRGGASDTFWAKTAVRVQRANPNIRVEAIEGAGHLVPLEYPQKVADLILDFYKTL
jgi:pimeloyl-ACP methyl ester carboxylesterase